jgi:hypothetical protein
VHETVLDIHNESHDFLTRDLEVLKVGVQFGDFIPNLLYCMGLVEHTLLACFHCMMRIRVTVCAIVISVFSISLRSQETGLECT